VETLVVTKTGGRDERARGLWEERVRVGRERVEGFERGGGLRWVLGGEACEWVLGMFAGPGGGLAAGGVVGQDGGGGGGAGVKRSAEEAGIQGGPAGAVGVPRKRPAQEVELVVID
jgi:hypothetical protein